MIFEIMKARKGMSFEATIEDLKDGLFKAANDGTKDFLLEQLTKLQNSTDLDEKLLNSVKKDIKERLGVRIEEYARRPLFQAVYDTYAKQGKWKLNESKMTIDFTFRDVDLRAIQESEKFNSWYIGGKVRDFADKEMSQQIKNALNEGWTIEKFGEVLEDTLGYIKDGYDYERLAKSVIYRTANLADVAAYEEAGIEYAKVVAVLDARTTTICKNMHGRIIEVAALSKTRDSVIDAYVSKDMKKLEKVSPFKKEWTPGTMTKEAVKNNISLPPYHFGCRTITVAYFVPSGVKLRKDYGKQLNDQMTKNIESFSDVEKNSWFNEMTTKAKDGKLKYNPKDLRKDEKHWSDFGTTKQADYIGECQKIVANPDKVWIKDYNNELQMAFEKDGRTVTTDKWSIRTTGVKGHKKYSGMTADYGRRIK